MDALHTAILDQLRSGPRSLCGLEAHLVGWQPADIRAGVVHLVRAGQVIRLPLPAVPGRLPVHLYGLPEGVAHNAEVERRSMNPNNCATCRFKVELHDAALETWCFMYRDEPQDICRQHTGGKPRWAPQPLRSRCLKTRRQFQRRAEGESAANDCWP